MKKFVAFYTDYLSVHPPNRHASWESAAVGALASSEAGNRNGFQWEGCVIHSTSALAFRNTVMLGIN